MRSLRAAGLDSKWNGVTIGRRQLPPSSHEDVGTLIEAEGIAREKFKNPHLCDTIISQSRFLRCGREFRRIKVGCVFCDLFSKRHRNDGLRCGRAIWRNEWAPVRRDATKPAAPRTIHGSRRTGVLRRVAIFKVIRRSCRLSRHRPAADRGRGAASRGVVTVLCHNRVCQCRLHFSNGGVLKRKKRMAPTHGAYARRQEKSKPEGSATAGPSLTLPAACVALAFVETKGDNAVTSLPCCPSR